MTPAARDATGSDPAVWLRDVTFAWPGDLFSLHLNEFRVEPGEKVLLLGESGAGKSTLLSLICGVAVPRKGSIRVVGRDLATLRPSQRDRFRANKIGIIFQMFNLLPYASAVDNILIPLRFSPERRKRCAHPRTDAITLCTAMGLPEALVSKGLASTLSVGQQQRVAVARAMIGSPEVIVADEPTSALDASAQGEFLDLLFRQVSATNAALIMVSHDARIADRFDRVLGLEDIATTRRLVPT